MGPGSRVLGHGSRVMGLGFREPVLAVLMMLVVGVLVGQVWIHSRTPLQNYCLNLEMFRG